MNDDNKEIRNFIIIFIIVILAVIGIYFFTKNIVKKEENTSNTENKETTNKEVTMDTTAAIVGNMLNKQESDYYVILFKNDDENVGTYMNMKTEYNSSKNALPVYVVDLSSGLNSKFYDPNNINIKGNNVNDYRFGDITLLEIKNGSIFKYYTSVDEIKKVWKNS